MFNSTQEAFDTVIKFMRNQGHPAQDGSVCMYLAGDGVSKCAVGCVLTDEELDNIRSQGDMSEPVSEVLSYCPSLEIKGLTYSEDLEFWEEMQEIHDHVISRDNWMDTCERMWREYASEFDLVYPDP